MNFRDWQTLRGGNVYKDRMTFNCEKCVYWTETIADWLTAITNLWFLFYFFRFYLFIFREGEGREKERERNINVWLPLTWSPLETGPATQACALTGNLTSDPLVHSPHSVH